MAKTVDITHAKVFTSTDISLDKLNEIKTQLEKKLEKNVIIETVKDLGLIGGIKIMVDGFVIDTTIKKDLEELKKYLYSKDYVV